MIFWWLAWAYTCIFVKLLWSWISQQGCTGSQARIAMAMVNVCDCSSTLWSILMYPIQSSKYYLSLRHSESVQVMIPQRILLDFYCWSWRDHAYIHIYTQKDVYVALLYIEGLLNWPYYAWCPTDFFLWLGHPMSCRDIFPRYCVLFWKQHPRSYPSRSEPGQDKSIDIQKSWQDANHHWSLEQVHVSKDPEEAQCSVHSSVSMKQSILVC